MQARHLRFRGQSFGDIVLKGMKKKTLPRIFEWSILILISYKDEAGSKGNVFKRASGSKPQA